ncbi:ABC transporter permease [Patulibacter defluvii]|uniref:ABC transporter permease n=1 Tax=Patulibacter defluvii TaxID=3095358 RepID=UPI002A749869|nr:ABC transporter permease [Patulibacter sp. DM4]
MSTRRSRILAGCSYLLLLAAWWGMALANDHPGTLWPSPPKVLEAIWDGRSALAENAGATMTEAALGFSAGVLLAIAIALVADRFRALGEGLQQIALAVYSLPLIALAPVLVIWFGAGISTKIIIAALASFFPVLINLSQALRQTDPRTIEMLSLAGAGGWQTFRRVKLPYALPPLFAAFTVAAPAAIVGAMLAEWVGAEKGLGLMILFSMTSYDVPTIWASLIVASALSLIVYALFSFTGRRLFGWHPSVQPIRVEA